MIHYLIQKGNGPCTLSLPPDFFRSLKYTCRVSKRNFKDHYLALIILYNNNDQRFLFHLLPISVRITFTLKYHFYRPQRSCGQGYVFTRVCDSVHRGGGVSGKPPPPDQADTPPGPGRPPRDHADPPREEDCSIRSMSGRYASYWNALLSFYSFPSFFRWLINI